jgi:hypothetical protein
MDTSDATNDRVVGRRFQIETVADFKSVASKRCVHPPPLLHEDIEIMLFIVSHEQHERGKRRLIVLVMVVSRHRKHQAPKLQVFGARFVAYRYTFFRLNS